DDSYTTLAELLADRGYDTAAVVSGPYLRSAFKLNQGFARYDDAAVSPAGTPAIDDVTNPQMEAKLIAYLAQRANQKRPFFLFAYFWDPHYDYIPPPPYDTMFVPPDAAPIDVTKYDTPANPLNHNSSPQERAYVEAQYDGEIRFTDDTLGRVFARMKELGLWDDTVVILTSDHGEEFFDHGEKGHKNNLYVESVHVPLIIKPAGEVRPRRDPRMASLVDVYPTVCEMAGVTDRVPLNHGRSLLAADAGRPIFFELTTTWYMSNRATKERWIESDQWLAVREGQFRMIGVQTRQTKKKQRKDNWQLFDVFADPREMKPLSGPAHDAILARLKSQVLEWEKRMKQLGKTLGKRGQADLTPSEIRRLKEMGYLN
ncbi:MAG: sulfatase, partial [Phycisphaerae bacterium]